MTIFNHLFGNAPSEARLQRVDIQKRFETLKSKYESALNSAGDEHIIFQSVHVMDDKLCVRATAPTQEAKDSFWRAIKNVDSEASDINAEIYVADRRGESSLNGTTYVVRQGDTLPKISEEFYGDANEYVRIRFANPGKIGNKRDVRVGQVLTIPYD